MNEFTTILFGWIVQNLNSITKFQVELDNSSTVDIPSKSADTIRAELISDTNLCAVILLDINSKSLADKKFEYLRNAYRGTMWNVFVPTDDLPKTKVQFIVPCLSVSDFRDLCDDLSKVRSIGTFEEVPVTGYTGFCFTQK